MKRGLQSQRGNILVPVMLVGLIGIRIDGVTV